MRAALGFATVAGVTGLIDRVPSPQASAQTQASSAVRVTLAAMGEEASNAVTTGPESGGITIQLMLENRGGEDLTDLRVRAPLPGRTTLTASSLGRPGNRAASPDGQGGLLWSGLALRRGERLGPFSFRVAPQPGTGGAEIFREAVVSPVIAWTRPSAGGAAVPLGGVQLNGLWGEAGLRRWVLPSGLTVFTRERPDSPTVSIRLAIRAASRDEDDTTSGGSHWLEHAHFLGTTTRENLDLEIEAVGGDSNASTGWEATDYWYLVPAEEFDLAIDVLADQMINSTFRAERFDREKRVVFEELKLRNDSPSTRSFDEFINLVFQVSPLRRHPAGTIESVQNIPISTILAYRQARYVTGNMAIAASGNLRHDETVAKIERAFAGLPLGPRGVRPATPEPPQTTPRRLDVGEGSQLAEIALGWPAPGDLHADAPAMAIIEDILGETGRRLAEDIRDQRALATSVDPSYFGFSDAGAFMISASTRPDRSETVIDLMLAQVRRLRDGDVTDQEVQASVRAIAGRQALQDESNQSQTSRARAEVSGVLESSAEYVARLKRVTAAEVQRVARQWLDPVNNTLIVVRA
jgi:predicted Zn-dependent peptidase